MIILDERLKVRLDRFLCLDVSPTHLLFEGGKLDLGKILSNQFQVSHSFNLAAGTLPSTYHFGTVFVGKSVAHFNLIVEFSPRHA